MADSSLPLSSSSSNEHRSLLPPDSSSRRRHDSSSHRHGSSRRWWVYATVMLCLYGFFKEFKPSEPYLTPFLTDNSSNSSKNFTKAVVNGDIYPFWSYSYLVAALCVALLTDVLHYKPVILLEAMAYLATRLLLIWGTSVLSMQMMQVVYGVATATEVAYFSYIYAAVSVEHFKRVTSYVRAVRLFGQASAGIMGQILVSTHGLTYLQLNYFSFASVSISCVFAVLLPNVYTCSCKEIRLCIGGKGGRGGRGKGEEEEEIKRGEEKEEEEEERQSGRVAAGTLFLEWVKGTLKKRWGDLKHFYLVPSLLRWSFWWALAMCGELQIGNYVQSLWKDIAVATGATYVYNGLVEALATLFSAAAAFVLALMTVNWPLWGELTIGALSLLDSAVLLVAATTNLLWLAYICHVLYRVTFSFLITIASAQLASAISHDSYALIFGLNTFAALVLQSFLTLAVSDEHGLYLPVRTQFIVYSGYYYLLTLIFVGAGIYKLTSSGWLRSFRVCCHEPIPATESQSESGAEGRAQARSGIQVLTEAPSDDESADDSKHIKLV